MKREIQEELKVHVDVKKLLLSQQVSLVQESTHPRHIGLAYYCRLISGEPSMTSEILSWSGVIPPIIRHEVAPFQRHAVELGRLAFERDRRA